MDSPLVPYYENVEDSFPSSPALTDNVDLKGKNDIAFFNDDEETSRDKVSDGEQAKTVLDEEISDPPNITDERDDKDVISPVVISPSVIDCSEKKTFHDQFVPGKHTVLFSLYMFNST